MPDDVRIRIAYVRICRHGLERRCGGYRLVVDDGCIVGLAQISEGGPPMTRIDAVDTDVAPRFVLKFADG